MDIQGYIIDHWMEKLTASHPVLMVYDHDGIYHDLLPLAAERENVKVVDSTRSPLHARLAASRFWCNEMAMEKDLRMIIYRRRNEPGDNTQWVEEPFSAFKSAAVIFPFGPQDDYKYICQTFLPTKKAEIEQLFEAGSTSFTMINALLDGAAYPELEQLTGGKTFSEMTVGLLAQTDGGDMKWLQEWQRFASIQYPGLDAQGSSLQEVQEKLWRYLLFSEFVFDLPETLPDSLKSISMAPEDIKDKIYSVCDKLRNQINLRETYVKMARKTSDALHLTDHFAKAKHLGDRVTFAFENTVEYERFIACLKEGNLAEARQMYDKNIKDVWYQEDAEVAAFWTVARYALLMGECQARGIKSDGSMAELVEWYAESGCDADHAFRQYHNKKNARINIPSAEKELTEYVNKVYAEFTERAVKEYQLKAKTIKDFALLRNQGCVQCVYPALTEGKRVVLFMVDAFRYEMGKYFAQSIERNFPERVKIEPKVSFLPSITRFGMAYHLDDITMVMEDGKLQPSINGSIVTTPEDRIKYLKEKTHVEVQDMRREDFDKTKIEDNTRLLVVRSTGIDVAGENDKLNGLAAMELEMIQLSRILSDCKQKEFDLAVFVADHGYMLQPCYRNGYLISKPVGSGVVLEESRMTAGNLNESEDILSFTPKELGVEADVMKFCYAKSFTVFRKGEVYYHEGLSLQENVVPLINIQLQEERTRNQFKLELKYKDKTSGTIYTRRPVIDINVYTEQLFSDDVNIRITVQDANGNKVGEPTEKLYNDLTQTVVIPSGVTKARQTIVIDDEYTGDSIIITALDADTNATLSTLKLNFEND